MYMIVLLLLLVTAYQFFYLLVTQCGLEFEESLTNLLVDMLCSNGRVLIFAARKTKKAVWWQKSSLSELEKGWAVW